ncbi:MAG TPA: patatin-like phospholipase family protein [Syntrophomonadaceae bacterium]|nr:patatin-like phospholipase family protein [Syntrophomonadaceae bacterium]HNX28872.1 patatin-like phospholipase family protein [Syntrophomonadaceae bacterium]HPR93260.1 patatin-like phospholipase family protein [Syntrophomonadaceae bacterium]
MKKLGLVLGGGGLKGMAHIGVLQVLAEHRIPVYSISGTSSGSIIAAFFAAGISPYEMERIVLNLKPSDYLDYNISGLLKYGLGLLLPGKNPTLDGLIKGQKLEDLMAYITDYKKLCEVKIPIAIIACNIDTGEEVVFSNIDPMTENQVVFVQDALLSEAIRSSTSIPGIFVPYILNGMQLVDGALKSVVPVSIQIAMGSEYIMTVNLGREHYQESVAGILQIISRTIDILVYETSDTAETLYSDLSINPLIPEVRIDETEKIASIIRAGRRAMLAQLGKLQRGLWQKNVT